ncbi:MAG: restriction endonuclease subunit S, partial [bacterium]|nr:restriction endonuclease subunit S [bacterium]
QDEIVQHIKEQSRKINQFIQKKKRFIELLKEQRQSIINHVVIKGINPSAKMKISGINWLGEVPQHWEVRRFGTLGEFSKGGNISRSDLAEIKTDFPAILYGDIYTKYDIKAETILNFISEETALNSTEIKSGDLLLTGSGETKIDIGKCIVYLGSEKVFVGGDVIIFKQTSFDSLFLSYSLNSDYSRMQKAISSKGDIIVHTYGSKLKNVILPIPPIEEQKHIVFHIKTQTANIDTTIAKTEREIGLIREYKEAMISEAVMGKRNINLQ